MSNKLKNSSIKKPLSTVVMKEIFQLNQLTTEILRTIIARSDDIAVLKSISDKKTGKLRMQSVLAEKTIQEIEAKEEWRLAKEEPVLVQLIPAKVEALFHKKQFEKLIKKILKVNTQFDEDPSEAEMNLSDVHVQRIMNIKIGPENTSAIYSENGAPIVIVPSAAVSSQTWKEMYSQPAKVTESFLLGEVVNLYPAMHFCVKHSRNNYSAEISRQKQAVEEGSVLLSPNIAVIITSKKSRNSLQTAKPSLSPARKLPPLPEPDMIQPLLKTFLELNSDIDKEIKAFIAGYTERNSEGKTRVSKTKDLVEKAVRVRNYEKFTAISPWVTPPSLFRLTTVSTLAKLQTMPEILFDLENPYFDESCSLAERIKIIHSCLLIQANIKAYARKMLLSKVQLIQRYFRGYLARKRVLLMRTTGFRKIYLWQRLRHWYALLVNRIRERRAKVQVSIDYSGYLDSVLIIQRCVRGWIDRKNIVKWKKIWRQMKGERVIERGYYRKQKIWKASWNHEDLAVEYSRSSEQDIAMYIAQSEKKVKRRDEKPMAELLSIKEKVELEIRAKYFGLAKCDRLAALE